MHGRAGPTPPRGCCSRGTPRSRRRAYARSARRPATPRRRSRPSPAIAADRDSSWNGETLKCAFSFSRNLSGAYMELGIVGLGRMGAGMARRLARAGVRVVCYDQAEAARRALAGEPRIEPAENLAALCARLTGERVIIIMLPAGSAVEDTIRDLLPLVSSGDTLVDGGNSYYRDSKRRALALSQQGLRYIDAGVSGGVHGLDHGFCLMLGGTPKSIEIFEPFAKLLAPGPEQGWLHCGPSGAGHYAKMIHNGIEYGMMQALAEGFALLDARPGADGVIAGGEVMKAAPDGYTLLLASQTAMLQVPLLKKSPPWDSTRDFTPIGLVGNYVFVFVADPQLPLKTGGEFVRYAKANPGKLNFGTYSSGGQLFLNQLKQSGLDLVQIPYKGEAPTIVDILGGRTQLTIAPPPSALQHIRAGKLQALAVLLPTRHALMPEVPTTVEAGPPPPPPPPPAALFGAGP